MGGYDRPPRYRSYLLRFWEERTRATSPATVWRFSLEDPRTGRRQGFATLDDLLAAMRRDLADDDSWPEEQW